MKHLIVIIALFTIAANAQVRRPRPTLPQMRTFEVKVDSVNVGTFTEISGLDSEIEIIEYQDGDDLVLRKRPGRVKYSDLVLKKGTIAQAGNQTLSQWWQSTINGNVQRKTIQVDLKDNTNQTVCTMTLYNTFPKSQKFTVGTKNDTEISFAVETMTSTCL
jgi:phage tail-like protein